MTLLSKMARLDMLRPKEAMLSQQLNVLVREGLGDSVWAKELRKERDRVRAQIRNLEIDFGD